MKNRIALLASLLACSVGACGGQSPSTAPVDLAHAPPDPHVPPPASPVRTTRAFAISSVNVGGPSIDGWRSIGLDIDGIATDKDSTNVCRRRAGAHANEQADGERGIDNNFGSQVVGVLYAFFGTDVNGRLNASLAGGGSTTLLVARGIDGSADQSGIDVDIFTALADNAPLANGATRAGDPASRVITAHGAYVTGGALVVPPIDDEVTFVLGNPMPRASSFADGNDAPFTLALPLRHVQIVAPIAEDGSIAGGTLSGIVPVRAVPAIVDAFGERMHYSLNAITTEAGEIMSGADIAVDGTNDSSEDCDGISVGLSFGAIAVDVAETH